MQVAWRWPYFEGTIPCPSPKDPAKVPDDERKAVEDWEFENLAARYLLSQWLPDSIAIRLQSLTTTKARWDRLVFEFTMQSVYAQNDLEEAFFNMRCTKGIDVRTFLTALRYKRKELSATGVWITQREYQRTILKSLPDELAKFVAQLLVSAHHSGFMLDTDILISSVIEESERLKNQHTCSQRGQGEKKKEGLTDEALTATGSEGSRRRHCRGHCHSCGKPGHQAHECCEPEEKDAAGVSNTQQSSSTPPTESENKPTGSANMVAEHSFKGDGFWTIMEEEVAPALTFRADPDPILGDPDEIWFGPQDLEQCFTWDGLDEWLCKETAEIKEEGLEGATTISREEAIFPLPQKATGPPDGPPPELIIAPVNVEGPEELLLDGAPQCATWHESQASAWAFEGHDPSGEVHGYPLHLLDPYFEAPVEGEPDIAVLKAQRPAFDERTRAQPDHLPGPGAATTELDACTRASVLLKGEQNSELPCVGCELYAAPCAPHPFSFSPSLPSSLKTAARSTAPGERDACVQHAAPCLEVLKPPDRNEPPLEEPGGVPLGLVYVAEKAGGEASKHVAINAREPGGVSLDANGAPAPTEGITSVEPASGAVVATAARPKALEPRAKNVEWSEL
jgi:hypothetical protein